MALTTLKDNIESEANLDERWSAARTDINGEMDLEQFPIFLQSLAPADFEGPIMSDHEMQLALKELDIDNNGKISLEEFKVWYRARMVILPTLGKEGDELIDRVVNQAFRDYLSLYLELVEEAEPVEQARSTQLLAGQKRYTSYRAEKDPARGMLTRFYGSEWTEAYIHDVLFDL